MTKIKPNTAYGRGDIAQGLFQRIGDELKQSALMTPLSEDERMQSLHDILASRPRHPNQKRADKIRVFAYGSLIWNPGFDYICKQPAVIYGYHRRFCLKSFAGRGSADHPGLLLGLDVGGSCRGISFEIAEHKIKDELQILWSREMMGGSYQPVWVKGRLFSDGTGQYEKAHFISFKIRHDTNRYADLHDLDAIAQQVYQACGSLGDCKDYVYNTYQALTDHQISETLVRAIALRLRKLEQENHHRIMQ